MKSFFHKTALPLALAVGLVVFPSISHAEAVPATQASAESSSELSGLALFGQAFAERLTQVEHTQLHLPPTLAITRPADSLSTTDSTYYIMGTSDPLQPLMYEGTALERQGDKGAFGLLVELELAENTITLQQGEDEVGVSITREEPEAATPTTIQDIVEDSMFPLYQGGTGVGNTLAVFCVAPSEAVITATLGEETVLLEQAAATALPGIPARFTGTLPLTGSFPPGQTTKVGPITYTMTYEDRTERYQSKGDIFAAGENAFIEVRVKAPIGYVFYSRDNLLAYKELVKQGATDYLTSQDNSMYGIYSGGVISAEMAEIVEGAPTASSKLAEATLLSASTRGESFKFLGTSQPIYNVDVSESGLSLTIYNTTAEKNIPLPELGNHSLFSDASVEAGDSSLTYHFPFAAGKASQFWGYQTRFTPDHALVLSIQHKPALSEQENQPLTGIRVMLDPGHGGTDAGALGFAGEASATEADLNLAYAYAVKNELQSLGATVILTREEDIFHHLDQRVIDHENAAADFFISLHHNSIATSSNGDNARGTEGYYYTTASAQAAETIVGHAAEGAERDFRFVNQASYRMTINPYSPALLLELGFVTNPADYEQAIDPATLGKVARGVANGIVASLS